jgi:adenylate cyclase class IV
LFGTFREYITDEQAKSLHTLTKEAKSFSVRTRGTPTQTIIVVKATVNDESSSNGTARIEWEVDLAEKMSLDEMDTKVLQAGFAYQAKWSRAREGYQLNDNTVLCLDKNAGYGYLAEFERVIDDASLVDSTRAELLEMIESLEYAELDQDRLARMFDFYNKNWSEYYGTEKVFIVE